MKAVHMEEAARRLPHLVREGEIGIIMATTAYWANQDESREMPWPAAIIMETEDCYYGRWIEDFEKFNVRFPKKTCRELCESEVRRYRHPAYRLDINYSIAA
jgi:hypothetical protein